MARKTKALYVLCEPAFMDALRRKAHEERIPVSRMVRDWLAQHLEEKPLEHAAEVLQT